VLRYLFFQYVSATFVHTLYIHRLSSSMSIVYTYIYVEPKILFLPSTRIAVVIIESSALSLSLSFHHQNVLCTMSLILYVLYIYMHSATDSLIDPRPPLREWILYITQKTNDPHPTRILPSLQPPSLNNLVSAYTLHNNPGECLDEK